MAGSLSRRAMFSMGFGALTALGAAGIISNARRITGNQESLALAAAGSGGELGTSSVEVAASAPQAPHGLAIPLADIPLGGGKVMIRHQVVATQPNEGEYYALHTKCPHDNCDIGDVREGQIICFCHGSLFSMSGGVKRGPARKGLRKREMEIVGETMYVTDVDPDAQVVRR